MTIVTRVSKGSQLAWTDLDGNFTDLDGRVTVLSYGYRNKIINGAMLVDQRNAGAAQSVPNAVRTYTLDRYAVTTAGAGVTTQQTSSGVGTLPAQFTNVLKITGTTGNTACTVDQRIESGNALRLASQVCQIAAAIYTDTAFTPTYTINSANAVDNFSSTTLVTSGSFGPVGAGAYTRVFATVTLNAACLNGVEFQINLGPIANGSVRALVGVSFEYGTVLLPYPTRLLQEDQFLCDRYFKQTSSDFTGWAASATAAYLEYAHDGVFRVAPTVTLPSTGFTNALSEFGVATRTPTALALMSASKQAVMVKATGAASMTANNGVGWVGPAIQMSAEL